MHMKIAHRLLVPLMLLVAVRLVAAPELPLAALETTQDVAERTAILDRFVHEHYYDPAWLMYSHVNWAKERPFTAADFGPDDSTMMGPEPHQWMSYENSP